MVAEGETIRFVIRNQGRTLRHGPIRNLDMPAMTMVFRVAQGQLLDGLNAGNRVRFETDRIDGVYTVTRIERLP